MASYPPAGSRTCTRPLYVASSYCFDVSDFCRFDGGALFSEADIGMRVFLCAW